MISNNGEGGNFIRQEIRLGPDGKDGSTVHMYAHTHRLYTTNAHSVECSPWNSGPSIQIAVMAKDLHTFSHHAMGRVGLSPSTFYVSHSTGAGKQPPVC